MTNIHPAAAKGFAVGAGTYVTGRPDYPSEVKGWLAQSLAIGPDSHVVELGAGTGKFTAALVRTGAEITAIEPVDEMRARIPALPRLTVSDGTAEAIPVADASADAVVCAQAFHWFANEMALREIRRVLKRGGYLGLIWNIRDESCAWVGAINGLLAKYQGETPQYQTGAWRRLFPSAGFGQLVERHVPHFHRGTAQEVIIDRVMSTSFMATLPEQEKAHVLETLEAIIRANPELGHGGEIAFPYTTIAVSLEAI